MILADKIIRMCKRNSCSQEKLAEKMGVSRQAEPKWESTQRYRIWKRSCSRCGPYGR